MAKSTFVTPAFALVPRGDLREQTLEWLNAHFERHPDDVLTVTTKVTRQAVRDLQRGKRSSLAHVREVPKRSRAV